MYCMQVILHLNTEKQLPFPQGAITRCFLWKGNSFLTIVWKMFSAELWVKYVDSWTPVSFSKKSYCMAYYDFSLLWIPAVIAVCLNPYSTKLHFLFRHMHSPLYTYSRPTWALVKTGLTLTVINILGCIEPFVLWPAVYLLTALKNTPSDSLWNPQKAASCLWAWLNFVVIKRGCRRIPQSRLLVPSMAASSTRRCWAVFSSEIGKKILAFYVCISLGWPGVLTPKKTKTKTTTTTKCFLFNRQFRVIKVVCPLFRGWLIALSISSIKVIHLWSSSILNENCLPVKSPTSPSDRHRQSPSTAVLHEQILSHKLTTRLLKAGCIALLFCPTSVFCAVFSPNRCSSVNICWIEWDRTYLVWRQDLSLLNKIQAKLKKNTRSSQKCWLNCFWWPCHGGTLDLM